MGHWPSAISAAFGGFHSFAQRLTTAEPQAAVWSILNQHLVLSENPLESVGSCGEAFLCNLCDLWFLNHCFRVFSCFSWFLMNDLVAA